MCTELRLNGKRITTVGELRAEVGEVKFHQDYPPIEDECCLCPVDVTDMFPDGFWNDCLEWEVTK